MKLSWKANGINGFPWRQKDVWKEFCPVLICTYTTIISCPTLPCTGTFTKLIIFFFYEKVLSFYMYKPTLSMTACVQ